MQGSPILRGGRLRPGAARQSAAHRCRAVAAEAEAQQAEQDADAHVQPRPMLANSVTELIGKSPPAHCSTPACGALTDHVLAPPDIPVDQQALDVAMYNLID